MIFISFKDVGGLDLETACWNLAKGKKLKSVNIGEGRVACKYKT